MNGFNDKKDDFLVEMTLLGSDKAFEELVVRYERRVIGTAYKVTKNSFSAEDASQDAFVCAWAKLNSLRDPSKFGPWVCAIAKNRAVSIMRHCYNASTDVSYELLQNTDLSNELDFGEILRQDRDDRLHEAVEALSEKIREAVKLHYFEGLSVEETAKKLDIPAGTVKWRLSEGRRQLRKEYGVMEKDKDLTFVQKVMYQVEQLKLWGLKNDKTGFEQEYREVLKNVEDLEECSEKQYMLADVLARGYWWVDKEANEEVFSRIKESAEKSHNEDIMEFVINKKWSDCKWEDKLDLMENTQAPYLVQKGFRKTLGYLYFWLAHELCSRSQFEKGIGYYKKVLETLKKSEVYYAAALGAVYIEEKKLREGIMPLFLGTTAEELMYKDGKLYLTNKAGYGFGTDDPTSAVFYYSALCDCVIFDENLKEGECFTASDKSGKVTCKGSGFTVETPSGRYENCICYVFEGYYNGVLRCETYFCPKIGIVKQICDENARHREWQLLKCEIKGGDEIVPFAEGNRWEYCLVQEDVIYYDMESVYEVVYTENCKSILSRHNYAKSLDYNENTWRGNILKARYTYYTTNDTGEFLSDVRPSFDKAEKLAKTKREKLHTSIAKNVMDRIFDTDPTANPDCTEVGYRNFFVAYHYRIIDEKPVLFCNQLYSFEWKEFDSSDEFNKIVYDYFYYDLCNIAGTVWSDKWVPGYKEIKEKTVDGKEIIEFSLEVFPKEAVKTAAGEFTGCRHIRLYESRRNEWGGYLNGVRDFWFAPEIGIVKYSRRFKEDPPLEAVWELTEYKGRGEGYFPVKDGLFRRYEPQELKDGWHGWVEYTFDEDESGVVVFKNTLGTRDREKIS